MSVSWTSSVALASAQASVSDAASSDESDELLEYALTLEQNQDRHAFAHFEPASTEDPYTLRRLDGPSPAAGDSITVSLEGIMRTRDGCTEFQPLLAYLREAARFRKIRSLPFFADYRRFKAFSVLRHWALQKRPARRMLSHRLLLLDANLRPALFELSESCRAIRQARPAARTDLGALSRLVSGGEGDVVDSESDDEELARLMSMMPKHLHRGRDAIVAAAVHSLAGAGGRFDPHCGGGRAGEILLQLDSHDSMEAQKDAHQRIAHLLRLADLMLMRALHERIVDPIMRIWNRAAIPCIDGASANRLVRDSRCSLPSDRFCIPSDERCEPDPAVVEQARDEAARLCRLADQLQRLTTTEGVAAPPPGRVAPFSAQLNYPRCGQGQRHPILDPPLSSPMGHLRSKVRLAMDQLGRQPLPSTAPSLRPFCEPLFVSTSRTIEPLDSDDDIIDDDDGNEDDRAQTSSARLHSDFPHSSDSEGGFTRMEADTLQGLRKTAHGCLQSAYATTELFARELEPLCRMRESTMKLQTEFEAASSDFGGESWPVARLQQTLYALDAQEALVASIPAGLCIGPLLVNLGQMRDSLLPLVRSSRSAIEMELPTLVRRRAEAIRDRIQGMQESLPCGGEHTIAAHAAAIVRMQGELPPPLAATEREVVHVMQLISFVHERGLGASLYYGASPVLKLVPPMLSAFQASLRKKELEYAHDSKRWSAQLQAEGRGLANGVLTLEKMAKSDLLSQREGEPETILDHCRQLDLSRVALKEELSTFEQATAGLQNVYPAHVASCDVGKLRRILSELEVTLPAQIGLWNARRVCARANFLLADGRLASGLSAARDRSAPSAPREANTLPDSAGNILALASLPLPETLSEAYGGLLGMHAAYKALHAILGKDNECVDQLEVEILHLLPVMSVLCT